MTQSTTAIDGDHEAKVAREKSSKIEKKTESGNNPTKKTSSAPNTVGPATDSARMHALLTRIAAAEKRLESLEQKRGSMTSGGDADVLRRVKTDLRSRGILSAKFVTVPKDYYDRPLEDRAKLLHCNTPQMCKTIVFENTAFTEDGSGDKTNSRYYCVIVQYAGAWREDVAGVQLIYLKKC